MRPTAKERFWSKVDRSGECWVWTSITRGSAKIKYGSFWLGGRFHSAHRLSWLWANGEIGTASGHHGRCVLHRCDNSLCVRPEHLFLGTHSDNMADKIRKGRHGSAVGERHHSTKLSYRQVMEIRSKYGAGETQVRLARRYGVTQANISLIVRLESRATA